MPTPAATLGKSFFASLILMGLAGSMAWQWRAANVMQGPEAEVSVEHTSSFGLALSLGMKRGIHYVEIGNEGKETIKITLPEEWERREVRFVPLTSILSDPPGLGFKRWHLPPGARVSYRTQQPWSSIILKNPSKIPFKVDLTIVNMEKESSERRVVLVKEETRVP